MQEDLQYNYRGSFEENGGSLEENRGSIGKNVEEEINIYEDNSEPSRSLKKCIRKESAICFTDYAVPGHFKRIFQTNVKNEECSEESCSSVESQLLTMHPGPQEEIEKCVAFWEKIMQENLEPIKCTLIKGKKQRTKEKEEELERQEVQELRNAIKSVKETEDKLKNIFIKAVADVQKHKLDKLKLQAKKKCRQCKIEAMMNKEQEKPCVDFNLTDIAGLNDWTSPANGKLNVIINEMEKNDKTHETEQDKEFSERPTLNIDEIVAEKEKFGAYRKWRETTRATCECNYLPDCICNTYKVISKESIKCLSSNEDIEDTGEEEGKKYIEEEKMQYDDEEAPLDQENIEKQTTENSLYSKEQKSQSLKKSQISVDVEGDLPDFLLEKIIGVANYDFDEDPNLLEAERIRNSNEEENSQVAEESVITQSIDKDLIIIKEQIQEPEVRSDKPPQINSNEIYFPETQINQPPAPSPREPSKTPSILLQETCICGPVPCNCPKRYIKIEHPELSNTELPTAPNIQTVSISAAVSSIELYGHLKIMGTGSSDLSKDPSSGINRKSDNVASFGYL